MFVESGKISILPLIVVFRIKNLVLIYQIDRLIAILGVPIVLLSGTISFMEAIFIFSLRRPCFVL